MDIAWSQVSATSGYRSSAFSACVLGDRVFVVGFDESLGLGARRFRVEAYSAGSGKPLVSWSDEAGYPFASLTTCCVSGDRVYVAGATSRHWSVIAFNRDLGVVGRVDFEKPKVTPFSATAVGNSLYVVGVVTVREGATAAYVAKISLRDLSLEGEFTYTPGTGAYAVVYSKKTRVLVVGGFVGGEWFLFSLDQDLKPLGSVKPGFRGSVLGLTVDPAGLLYAVDGYRVVKLSERGDVLASLNIPAVKVHASQEETSPLGKHVAIATSSDFHLVRSSDMATVDSAKLTREQALVALPGNMDTDNKHVYLALTQVTAVEKWEWVVYALRLRAR